MPIVARRKDSLLTTSSGYTNYRGILNLVIILLVLSNARAALENFIKYGLLVQPFRWLHLFSDGSQHWPSLNIVLGLGFHTLVALSIERFLAAPYLAASKFSPPLSSSSQSAATNASQQNGAQQARQRLKRPTTGQPSPSTTTTATTTSTATRAKIKHRPPLVIAAANCLTVINLVAVIAIPPYIVNTNNTNPFTASFALMLVSIVFLKLVSYHMMNFWCRDVRRPIRQRARTTRSFLRTYTPPSTEFECLDDSCKLAKAEKLPAAGGTTVTSTIASSSNPVPAAAISKLAASQHGRSDTSSGVSSIEDSSSSTSGSVSSTSTPSPSSSPNASQQLANDSKEALSAEVLTKLYPHNITLANMVDFISVPTLCYDLDFARTATIRKRFVLKRVLEAIVLSQLDLALIQQWIVPTVENSLQPFRQMKFSLCVERLLKLAIPNHIIWLIWFYMFFHSILNIIAELTRFADREFYRDWWNSKSVYYFWSNWNIPVHKWCARHLYVPLISFGLTRCQASTAVFFVSAFFHEYLVSVPLKLFRMWSFMGMLMQLPLARFVSAYFNSNTANVAVWVTLIIGQPLAILMYYHDYYIINYRVVDNA